MIKRLCILFIILISYQSLIAKQEVVLNRDRILFKLELLSQYELSVGDTLKVKFTIANNSKQSIAVVDFDMPDKKYEGFVNINYLKIELKLGGNLLADHGMVRKFTILETGAQSSVTFEIPVIRFISKFLNWLNKEGPGVDKFPYPYVKNVKVVAAISYSDSHEFIDGRFKEVTEFNDYWGIPKNEEIYYEIATFVEIFELSGISVKINLPSSK